MLPSLVLGAKRGKKLNPPPVRSGEGEGGGAQLRNGCLPLINEPVPPSEGGGGSGAFSPCGN